MKVRPQPRQCPQEWQDRIDERFGTNPYGEPIFRLSWGQTETMRAGGIWMDGFKGYRDILVARNAPCWMILMWEPAICYGPPELWYFQNKDEATGLQMLGEYPYHGRYRVLHQLIHREIFDNKLRTLHLELTSLLIDSIIPLCKVWQDLSKETQVELLIEDERIRKEQAAAKLAESKAECAPARFVFGGQGAKSSVIGKKVHVLETQFKRLMAATSQYERGFQQVDATPYMNMNHEFN